MDAEHYELDATLAEAHWWWVGRRWIISHLMDKLLDDGNSRTILEVGCSTGSNLAMLERYGAVEAMEMFAPAADHCRQRHPRIPVYNEAIPTRLERQYDVICLFDVLEHIEDDVEAMDWIDRHLAPGGTLFLTVPAFQFLWSRHDELAHHFRRYTRGRLRALLNRRFLVRYATYFNFHLFPLIAAVRLLQRLFGLGGKRDKAAGGTGLANPVLKSIFAAERMWLPGLSLPFGVSIFAAARKV